MNIPRQQKRTEATAAATAAQKNAEPKREDRWVSQFYMNNKNSSEPHMWCAHENPRFYLFSDVIFFLCVFFLFLVEFVLKIRFVFHRFALALENHPRLLLCFFFLCRSEPRIFSLPVSFAWPFHISGRKKMCVSRTLMPPMSTHATSRI